MNGKFYSKVNGDVEEAFESELERIKIFTMLGIETTKFGLKNPQISVVEIDKPELSPSVMCNRLASHIERGTAFRRATMWTLQQIMENGAMGVQITISGKLRGDRSAFEKHSLSSSSLFFCSFSERAIKMPFLVR